MEHQFFTRWLWPLTSKRATPSFRIRTKLNSDEALRRLHKVRASLQMSKEEIVDICQMVEREGKLQRALFEADTELLVTILAVRTYHVGEREYIGTAVLTFESLMARTRALFLKAHPALRTWRGSTPSELHFLARTLAEEIHSSLVILTSVREKIRKEDYPDDTAKVEVQISWTKWMCLPCGRSNSGRGMKADSGNSIRRSEEHHEREHLFTGNGMAVNGGRCRCLDYR
ncbi:uncharacterized protein Z520_06819 [Fonsecaea multimorphosa CBS 102226]|uniref:Uncharacterized protein n=1 Tax=Fonsecaea multimorphosa CBS 102226 TaxID=1442371 RepID=A0A0D2JV57_9EURO|nr:uncharacterized protein Z520_06819 [Fonsecaea multimorphosa CBS 102226]KIX97367.1 hypothetical protein Z520_06819 [Fonsecaea multimorphosa CBS 102226]OAL23334.1 hypothetical protein AYO22_06384 [Fonsecaea multimorphosa]